MRDVPYRPARHAILFELIRQQNLAAEREALFAPAQTDDIWQGRFTERAVRSLGM